MRACMCVCACIGEGWGAFLKGTPKRGDCPTAGPGATAQADREASPGSGAGRLTAPAVHHASPLWERCGHHRLGIQLGEARVLRPLAQPPEEPPLHGGERQAS